jgi:LuxR family transcriptional regulator, maltose regulon positive regulatory protein
MNPSRGRPRRLRFLSHYPRESDILRLIAEGLSNKEVARDLAIAPETVKSHIKHIFIKLNVETRAQAVSRAQILGLVGIHR